MPDNPELYNAVMLAEGERDGTEQEVLKAWQRLIDTGLAWKLQGWFGRRAAALIESGACKPPSPTRTGEAT
jgi:hypothetical protein